MERIVVVMAYERATVNKYVYGAEDKGSEAVESIYVKKWAVGDSPPPRIQVVVGVA